MADQLTASQMEQSVQDYLETQALNSPDRFSTNPEVKASAEARAAAATKARAERLGPPNAADPNAPIDLSRVTEEDFRRSMTGDLGPHTAGRDIPKNIPATAASALGPQLLSEGLNPRFMEIYQVDAAGNVPQEIYDMAVRSKALHFSDASWMAKLNAGDVGARQTYAGIRFAIAAGPAKKPV
jgi:hypothetical protein